MNLAPTLTEQLGGVQAHMSTTTTLRRIFPAVALAPLEPATLSIDLIVERNSDNRASTSAHIQILGRPLK